MQFQKLKSKFILPLVILIMVCSCFGAVEESLERLHQHQISILVQQLKTSGIEIPTKRWGIWHGNRISMILRKPLKIIFGAAETAFMTPRFYQSAYLH